MPRQPKPGVVQFALDISADAKLRFETLHESFGFKTKSQTFEAVLYAVSTKDKIDPAAIGRIEKKLDHALRVLDLLT